ncbi:MAG: hypothetical protein KC656_11030 [Myxococcales bacterium]|nr:hypothetical protein [Myxococcales bacterium]
MTGFLAVIGITMAFATDGASGVQEVRWARPFRLERALMYRHTPEPRAIREGWILELLVDPARMVPHPIATPTLFVDTTVAVRTAWRTPCAVVWVPGDVDPARATVFFGSTELPERIDATRAAAELSAADARPVPVGDVSRDALVLTDANALYGLAEERRRRCEGTTATSP